MNPRKLFLPILLFVLALFSFHLWAQPTVVTNPATGLTNTVITNATTIVQNLTPTPSLTSQSPAVALAMILIPLVVPLLVAVFKFFLPKLPSWTLPILATALGALLNWISTAVGGPGVGPLTATLLGAAGVGVREIIDQLKPDTKAGAATVASMVALCLFVPVFYGCTTNQQRIAANTLSATHDVVQTGVESYYFAAATGLAPTNGIPQVGAAYNKFQGVYVAAVIFARNNTNALAPANVIQEATSVATVIGQFYQPAAAKITNSLTP